MRTAVSVGMRLSKPAGVCSNMGSAMHTGTEAPTTVSSTEGSHSMSLSMRTANLHVLQASLSLNVS